MYNLKLDQLKSLHEIIIGNEVFQHKITMSKGKRGEKRYYHIYNQLSACFVRIRETCHYLSDFHFRKSNICGQAFDFYEFVNCISIILGCVENLFGVFNVQLNDYYKSKKVFFKSNKTKQNDIKFFKFIRSASAVHPSETTNYNKITKLKFEVYPYALWAGHLSMFLLDNIPQDFDIELIGWNSRTNSYNNYYYLYINEFYDFVNELLASIKNLIPIVQKIVEENRERERFKVVKSYNEFDRYSDYLIYLRKRLLRKNKNEEFTDGGLLLAAHIMENDIIGYDFKSYIKQRVCNLVLAMKRDIAEVSYNDIFDDLSIYQLIKDWHKQSDYIAEKFNDYLHRQALYEIKQNEFFECDKAFLDYDDNLKYSDAEWSVHLLLEVWDKLFVNVNIFNAKNFTDIYELTLEEIYLQKIKK